MAGMVKGPAIFLAQFADDKAPFNSFPAICQWAASLGCTASAGAATTNRSIAIKRRQAAKDRKGPPEAALL